jgi:2-hydroxycyclohexanecarboxyl-CoA dehydrogenase
VKPEGLDGRVGVVTGAARGIGLPIAAVLRDQGVCLAGLAVDLPETSGVLGLVCDVSEAAAVSKPAAVSDAFGEVRRRLGELDGLVMNAAILKAVPLEEVTLDWWERSLAVDFTGVFLCAREVLPSMWERGHGRTVAIGSGGAKTGGALPPGPHGATKAAMMRPTKTSAVQYAKYGITANVVGPIHIETPMLSLTGVGGQETVRRIPVGRLGTPDDVAAGAAFLCSAHAGYLTAEVPEGPYAIAFKKARLVRQGRDVTMVAIVPGAVQRESRRDAGGGGDRLRNPRPPHRLPAGRGGLLR